MNKFAPQSLAEHAQTTLGIVCPDFCVAVRPNNCKDFIPVRPSDEPVCELGACEWQYSDAEGNVWASLTMLESNAITPAWQVASNAGGLEEYYANFYTVAGSGEMDIWYHGDWHAIGKQYDLAARRSEAVLVKRTDTYQLQADAHGLGVLALYLEVPFADSFEEQVPRPQVLSYTADPY